MKKSEAKRQAILETAYRLFREQGFEKTSMSEITAQVGGSKGTLYSHFSSKEGLFAECLTEAIEQFVSGPLASLDKQQGDMEPTLRHFGVNFLQCVCSSDMIDVQRLLFAESARLGMGPLSFSRIIVLRDHVAAYLGECMEAGKLRREDPVVAANHLRGLLESEVLEPLLLNAIGNLPDEAGRTQAAQRAVSVFLRAYAPDAR
jgi:AcrR family transcriptional regulator